MKSVQMFSWVVMVCTRVSYDIWSSAVRLHVDPRLHDGLATAVPAAFTHTLGAILYLSLNTHLLIHPPTHALESAFCTPAGHSCNYSKAFILVLYTHS